MKRVLAGYLFACAFLGIWQPETRAHQPVMDMAPRWKGGKGFQIRFEHDRKDVWDGAQSATPGTEIPLLDETLTAWWEGVYTFTRETRITLKAPFVSRLTKTAQNGTPLETRAKGLGDLVLGFQNKRYFNRDGITGNVSLTPSLRLPSGTNLTGLNFGPRVISPGLSLSGSVEMFRLYGLLDVFTWLEPKDSQGQARGGRTGFNLDLGWHPIHSNRTNTGAFLMVGLNGQHQKHSRQLGGIHNPNSGGRFLEAAPTLVLYKGPWMWRTQVHLDIWRQMNGHQLISKQRFQTGLGIVFP